MDRLIAMNNKDQMLKESADDQDDQEEKESMLRNPSLLIRENYSGKRPTFDSSK